ncbi:hypothetical protein M405DRAFT_195574 [Rhizopogon salebrosus TDB-379]|nr:hypothetical protein M405DRAFT_195574 [Rhizopogon salebrosus TDB-379]
MMCIPSRVLSTHSHKPTVPVILMHPRGDAGSNEDYNQYKGGFKRVCKLNCRRWFVIADPGIGFSRTVEENCALLREAHSLTANTRGNLLAGYPQLIITEVISWCNSGAPGCK